MIKGLFYILYLYCITTVRVSMQSKYSLDTVLQIALLLPLQQRYSKDTAKIRHANIYYNISSQI